MGFVGCWVDVLTDVFVFNVEDCDCVVLVGCCVSVFDVVDSLLATVVCCKPVTAVDD